MRAILCTLSCACLPVLGCAQTVPRLYLGVGASLLTSRPFQSYSLTNVGPSFTMGLQLSPRWAIQTGANLGWGSDKATYNQDSASVRLGVYQNSLRRAVLVVPLLARFTVGAPTARLHVEVLAGASWAHMVDERSGTYLDATQPARNRAGSYTLAENTANAVLGPALRYTLGPHVDLTVSALLHFDCINRYHYDFGTRSFLNTQFGAQYRFGR